MLKNSTKRILMLLHFDLGYCVSSFLIGSLNLGYQLIIPYDLIWKLIVSSVAKVETYWLHIQVSKHSEFKEISIKQQYIDLAKPKSGAPGLFISFAFG